MLTKCLNQFLTITLQKLVQQEEVRSSLAKGERLFIAGLRKCSLIKSFILMQIQQ